MEKIIREENHKSGRGRNNQIHNVNPEMQQLNYNINLSHAIMGEHITPLVQVWNQVDMSTTSSSTCSNQTRKLGVNQLYITKPQIH
jgi:hypothetical protein